jgi:hypothetical protein
VTATLVLPLYAGWVYNSSGTAGIGIYTNVYSVPGFYKAKGVFRIYNGSGYTGKYTGYTPVLEYE